jgi:hypothetical protein
MILWAQSVPLNLGPCAPEAPPEALFRELHAARRAATPAQSAFARVHSSTALTLTAWYGMLKSNIRRSDGPQWIGSTLGGSRPVALPGLGRGKPDKDICITNQRMGEWN